jgi:hypothetical protein
MALKANRRCLATFQPQAWINDYAIDIDGAFKFDITDQVETLGPAKAKTIRDSSDLSDGLYYNWLREHPGKDAHRGPFSVSCAEAIAVYFAGRK